MAAPTIEALLLTGGESRRMGRDKATLPIDGEAQALRIVRALAAVGIPITVLGKSPIAGAEFRPDGAEVRSPLEALRRAEPTADLVMVLSCDLPRFEARLVPLLADLIGSSDAAVPVVDGFRQPTVAMYRREAFLKIPSEGCPMDWLTPLDVRLVSEWELEANGVSADATRGANTPEELDRLLESGR